jgi:hypothetical protein
LAQARPQHGHDRLARAFRHFIEAQPVVLHVELGVLPLAPLLGIDGEAHRLTLLRRELRQQRTGGIDHLQDRGIGRLQREQAG